MGLPSIAIGLPGGTGHDASAPIDVAAAAEPLDIAFPAEPLNIAFAADQQCGVVQGMVTRPVWQGRPREAAARRNEAVDASHRIFPPADVERPKSRKELELAIRKLVMNPPGHGAPVTALGAPVGKPGQHDTRHRPHVAVAIALVPDVTAAIALVRGAVQAVLIAKCINGRCPICGADGKASKSRLQGFQ
jgi:hypothetical protein